MVKVFRPDGHVIKFDVEDWRFFFEHRWQIFTSGTKNNKTHYAVSHVRRGPWFNGSRKPVKIRLHRLIMCAPGGVFVDHVNNNGLDNRKENLRPCTIQQNARNSRAASGSSRFKGVSWNKQYKMWSVQIKVATQKRLYVGRFHSEIEAAEAYDRMALKHFSDFAHLNFPQK